MIGQESGVQRSDLRDRYLKAALLAMAAVSIFVNLVTVFRGKAFWMDEWFIIANIKFRSAASLFGPLDYIQEFPRLYLALVQALVKGLNYAAFSYRLIPFLIQCANVGLVWLIGRRYLYMNRIRRSAFLLLLFLANMTTIFYFTKIKHYTMDIFISLLAFLQYSLLLEWARKPRLDKKFAVILAVGASGPFFSYCYEYYVVPIFLVAAFYFLRSIKRGRPNWLYALPILIFIASLALSYQINLKYTLSNGAQRDVYSEFFVNPQSAGLLLNSASGAFLEFFSEFLFVPESIHNAGAALVLRLARYGFGLLTLIGLGIAGAQLKKKVRRLRLRGEGEGDPGPEFFFIVSMLAVAVLFLAHNIPLGLARLDYFAFLPMAYFAIAGLGMFLGHPWAIFRGAAHVALAGLIIFFGTFFAKANYNELRGRAAGFDQAVFDNVGAAIHRAYATNAVLVVLGDTPLDPAITLDYTDPRRTAILNKSANELIVKVHPAFLVKRPLRVIALNSIREIGRISGLSPAQPLIIVRPASFNETTAAAASVNTDKTASFR